MPTAVTGSPDAEPVRVSTFEQLATPLRREIKLHCYRMLGAVHEAEDAVQEAYLRAWRHFDGFDAHGSFRAWLYRIATNACLDALAARKRRARLLPDRHGPATTQMADGVPAADVAWLEPYPSADLDTIADAAPNPEARYSSREATSLAFVAVIQHVPPRQRAVLLLCDVLGWSAAEVATLLGGTLASINSALQRARDTLAKHHPAEAKTAVHRPDAAQQKLLRRYMRAWEARDLDAFASILRRDAQYTMPPLSQWYDGREAIRVFFAQAWPLYSGFRLVPTGANGQPAFAAYARSTPHAAWEAHSLHVLALSEASVARLTLYAKPLGPSLFAAFGLPPEPAVASPT